jgi:hypothetical protein
MYIAEGKVPEGERVAREVLVFNRKKQPDDWQRFRAESLLSLSLAGQTRYADAEPLLLGSYHGMLVRKEKMNIPDRFYLDRTREWMDRLYPTWHRSLKAADERKR